MTGTTPASPDLSRHARTGRGKIYGSILETIGDTPLVALPRLSAELKPKARVLAKLEFFNPLSSVKDRIGLAMIEGLEQAGKLPPDSVLIAPTSGNTGIALALLGAPLALLGLLDPVVLKEALVLAVQRVLLVPLVLVVLLVLLVPLVLPDLKVPQALLVLLVLVA